MIKMSSVLRIYQDVIEDVISGVREAFLEDKVDEQVLQELRQTWESKLLASKAVDGHQNEDKGFKKDIPNGTSGFAKQAQQVKQVVGQVPPNNHVQTQSINPIVETKMVPIQITLPPQPGSDLGQRILTVQVPATALQGNQLHKVLTGPVISATMGLPQPIANSVLQQHVNAAFNSTPQTVTISSIVNKPVIQGDGALLVDSSDDEMNVDSCSFLLEATSSKIKPDSKKLKHKKHKKIKQVKQVDGNNETSDEDEDGSDDDEGSDEADDDKDEDEQEMEDAGPEEEPLNSEDDVTDEDPSDLFDTENIVVCQYDKISRSRNKWKFHLKDGIMNLNGEDFVFQKANGDAEW